MKKNIMVCVDLNIELINLYIEDLKSWDFTKINSVHFVHGFLLQQYGEFFSFESYPPRNLFKEMNDSVLQTLGAS